MTGALSQPGINSNTAPSVTRILTQAMSLSWGMVTIDQLHKCLRSHFALNKERPGVNDQNGQRQD